MNADCICLAPCSERGAPGPQPASAGFWRHFSSPGVYAWVPRRRVSAPFSKGSPPASLKGERGYTSSRTNPGLKAWANGNPSPLKRAIRGAKQITLIFMLCRKPLAWRSALCAVHLRGGRFGFGCPAASSPSGCCGEQTRAEGALDESRNIDVDVEGWPGQSVSRRGNADRMVEY